MSALRFSTPTGGVNLGPQEVMAAAPLRGYSHRPHAIGGSFVRPLSTPPAARIVPTFCGMCGEQLPPRHGPRGRLQAWCSQACRSKASRDRRRTA